MGRKYTATLVAGTFTNAGGDGDLLQLRAPTTAIVKVHSIFVGQAGDAGDAQAEMLRIRLVRATGTYTQNLGSAITPAPHEPTDPAAGSAVTGLNMTAAAVATGAFTTLLEETFNVQAGWYYTPTPEEQIVLRPSPNQSTDPSAIIVHIPSTAADDLTVSARITFEEIG